MSSLIVSLPRELLGVLDIPETQLDERILELIALELFRQERVSAGKAAELIGISKWEFVQLLARHDIPYLTESPDELRSEVAGVESLLRQNRSDRSF